MILYEDITKYLGVIDLTTCLSGGAAPMDQICGELLGHRARWH